MRLFIHVLSVLVFAAFALAGTEYSKHTFLFSTDSYYPALQVDLDNKKITSNSSPINELLKRYPIIKLKKWLTSADESDIFNGTDFSKIYRVTLDQSQTTDEVLSQSMAAFSKLDFIKYVNNEPLIRIDFPIEPFAPFDPFLDRQWYVKRILADYAWALPGTVGQDLETVLLGVVDTGLDYLHPDLEDALYINPGEDIDGDGLFTSADANGIDDDKNGFIDDISGWDFVGASDSSETDNDVRPPIAGKDEWLSHGTHVAGIMAAVSGNELGISGLSVNGIIIATKHSYDEDLAGGYLWNAYDGILYCAKMGAQIINCSWGGRGSSEDARNLIDHIVENYGSIIVCASGNDNTNNDLNPHFPSDYENTISVAALSTSDQKAYFSNYGEVIDISAPGMSIFSTIHNNAGGYASWQGTSMASPVVAGALGFLKGWFPDMQHDSLYQLLDKNSIDISGKNYSYAGKLGCGMVNLYQPIAKSIFPDLHIVGNSIQLDDVNSDDQLNPGETFSLQLSIKNQQGWRDASSASITLQTSSDYFELIDSTADIGNIKNNEIKQSSQNDLRIRVLPEAQYKAHELVLKLIAPTESGAPYQEISSLFVTPAINQTGFPKKEAASEWPVTLSDLDADGYKEIIVLGSGDSLFVYNHLGQPKSGFPLYVGGYTTMPPVVADMNGDGKEEIGLVTREGMVRIFSDSAQIIAEHHTENPVYGNASAADVNGDELPDLVFGSMHKQVYSFSLIGDQLVESRFQSSSLIEKGIALADIGRDSISQLIYGTFEGKLHVESQSGKSIVGWPIQLSSRVTNTPVFVANGEKKYIIVTTIDRKLSIFNLDGAQIASYQFEATLSGGPSAGRVDASGKIYIVFFTTDHSIHIVDLNGQSYPGYPQTIGQLVQTSPILCDFNADGIQELIFGSATGSLLITNIDGQNLTNFPAEFQGHLNGTATIDDLDNDDDLEILISGSSGLQILDLQVNHYKLGDWATEFANMQRTNSIKYDICTVIEKLNENKPFNIYLRQNYPNPFNPVTRIEYSLPDNGYVDLTIYDISGQEIIRLVKEKQRFGTHKIVWNGKNTNGIPVNSGLYLYKIVYKNEKGQMFTSSNKMILLK